MAQKRVGNYTIVFECPPRVSNYASVAGKKESEGPLGHSFDVIFDDPTLGKDNWEAAESELQFQVITKLLEKSNEISEHIQYIFSGDLLGQTIASSFGIAEYQIPYMGLYGACSTMGEALALAAMTLDGGFADQVIALTSSHFASAEKQFRFPLNYGNQRALTATWTVTGSGAVLLDCKAVKDTIGITAVTIGKIVDYGIKDSQNMGACMAPAAAFVIAAHLRDMKRMPEDYDCIITGDLGSVGKKILLKLMEEEGYDLKENHLDCGLEIFSSETQDTHAGGSGCGCSALVLCGLILKRLESGQWKRVLFVPTGALLSKISFNEGQTIPGIAHGIVFEKL